MIASHSNAPQTRHSVQKKLAENGGILRVTEGMILVAKIARKRRFFPYYSGKSLIEKWWAVQGLNL